MTGKIDETVERGIQVSELVRVADERTVAKRRALARDGDEQPQLRQHGL